MFCIPFYLCCLEDASAGQGIKIQLIATLLHDDDASGGGSKYSSHFFFTTGLVPVLLILKWFHVMSQMLLSSDPGLVLPEIHLLSQMI
jgi:hypothetical protein